ncbi:MAG: 4-hydroxy-tetrahydrodipicolinate synthase [Treponema sp.]|nr:4-hydroxy-tetrahydrodipicolinate synthase [Treponema sp.]
MKHLGGTMVEFKGIITALVTPMHDDERINEQELRNQVNRQIEAGVHGLFVFGTNGESYILSGKEKLRILELVVEENRGRLPVYAGTGLPGTAETIRLSREAVKAGADALSVITPYFASLSQDELYRHYAALADAVDVPVIMYNIPARTGVSITVETAEKLKNHGNIKGIKDSSGSFDTILQLIERTGDRLAVLSGNDSLVLWTLQAGGNGGVCGIANLFPRTMVSIYELWKAGKFGEAKEAQDSIRAIRNCFKLGNPNTIVKLAANLLGYPVGPCRRPFYTDDPRVTEKVREVLETHCRGLR